MGATITIKLRLKDKHVSDLNRQTRAINFAWNYCNETSRKAWGRDRRWLSAYDLVRLTSGSSKILGVHAHSIQGVCKQFARSRDKVGRAGLRWRGRRSLGWIPFNTGHVSFDGERLKFNGRFYEPMHFHPKLAKGQKIHAGSFSQDARGRWYVNLPVEVECVVLSRSDSVGVDLGLKTMATLSDGRAFIMPKFYRESEAALAVAQKARKSKRSRSIHMKIANRRGDYLHKLSSSIVADYGLIVIGDVSPSKLARTKMAKSVLDAGWSSFKRMLSYKAVMHGGRAIEVDERWTTQTCSHCGSLPPERPRGIAGLGIREWTCGDCGAVHDRDVNAAKNILRVGLDALAEGVSA